MQPVRGVKLIVTVAVVAGCASTPRAVCGNSWSPLSTERAHVVATGVVKRDATTITAVRIAGVDARLAATLRGEIATKPGDVLLDAPIPDDLRRLWKLGVIDDARVTLDGSDVTFVLAPRPMIARVASSGGDALAQARFRQLVATPFEPSRVHRMTEALEESYVRAGRLDARVEARQRVHADGVDVCVAMNPGARITIGKLEFAGAKSVSQASLRARLSGQDANVNRAGGTFDEAALAFDTRYLFGELLEHGLVDAKIGKPILKRRGTRLDVAIPIDEGPRYRFGTIVAPLPVALRTGDVFRRSRIIEATQALQQQLNANVYQATYVDRETRTVDITFSIEWRYPWDALPFWLSQSRSSRARTGR